MLITSLAPRRAPRLAPLALTLLVGCGVSADTHRAALRDLEDARIVAALATSDAQRAQRDERSARAALATTQAELATTQRALATLQQRQPSPPHSLKPLQSALASALAEPIARGALRLSERDAHVIITIDQAALFDDGRSTLRHDARALVLRCWRASEASGVTRARVVAAPPHPGDDATLATARARAVASVATQQTALGAALWAGALLRDPSPARDAQPPTLELWLSDAPAPQASPS